IAIADGSVLKTSFTGSCLSIASGKASYQGRTTTSGTLHLSLTLAIEAPINKSIPLPAVTLDIPAVPLGVDLGTQAAAGAADMNQGPCTPVSPGDGGMSPGADATPSNDATTAPDGAQNDAGAASDGSAFDSSATSDAAAAPDADLAVDGSC